MSEGTIVKRRQERTMKSCQHRWIIETPHGVTSRGVCKQCGTSKRFPNAAEDAIWQGGRANLGRWAGRRGVAKPAKISLGNDADEKV